MKSLFTIVLSVILMSLNTNEKPSVKKKSLKVKPVSLGFTQIYKDPDFQNLTMIGDTKTFGVAGDEGKILRVLRFKNITDVTEKRYGLPSGCILAMIAQESSGVDLLPNGLGDGGFGLCHMQPKLAKEFGLKTYGGCTEMVCKSHAKKLKEIIEDSAYDRKKVIKFDDRLHPILNIDCVGRMLAHYKKGKRIGKLTAFQTALRRYAGKYNYPDYLDNVDRIMKKIKNPKYIATLGKKFNSLNPNLTCDGKKINFDGYIAISRKQSYNYGLKKYISHK